MSAFRKNEDISSNIKGTKVKNNLLYISSGIPSLDHVIGGGLPTGGIFMVAEDVLGNYSRVMNKYFLAEGITCNHSLFIASADVSPQQLVEDLPLPILNAAEDDVNNITNETDQMKIAWRYEGLGQVQSSFGANANFGHNYDLSKKINEETIKNCKITYWNYSNEISPNNSAFKNEMYVDLLNNIRKTVSEDVFQPHKKEKQSILRVSISSLGSPIWMANDIDSDTLRCYGQDLIKFMYCLRIILKDTNAVSFITIPTHLLESDAFVNRLLYSVDNAVRLESFAGSSRETNPVFKDYNGLFHVTKLTPINTLLPFVPPSLDLAFKLRRKKFVIEKLHLPPELDETSEREQDDITATPMACGGFKKKDIDF